ncbi:recombinase family protein, partial [Escherichia coli]|nr:recombinase family protein [Escherichia coli]
QNDVTLKMPAFEWVHVQLHQQKGMISLSPPTICNSAVWKLDRLGRSVKQLVDLVGDLHKHGVQFRSLTDSIDTGTPSGRFFFHVMASLAEMERELTVERTRAGLEVAKQLGRKGGRKPKMTDSKIESAKKLLASGVPPKDVAKNLGVSIPTLYRWVPASTHA